VIAVLGGAAQHQTSRWWQVETDNRLLEEPETRPV
jgi:hypothetical protein